MSDNIIFERNILALSANNRILAEKTGFASPCPDLNFILSKNNYKIPVINYKGRPQPIHSKFDPIKEGQRIEENSRKNGYYVFLGMGAGFHITPFLNRKDITNILIIDKDISIFRSILENIDLREIFLNNKVKLLIDENAETVNNFLLSDYFPAVTGNLNTIILRERIKSEEEYFDLIIQEIKKTIGNISDDYTVQACFGKKWFKNTLFNLEAAGNTVTVLKPIQKAIVTGAGPSLEIQIDKLLEFRPSCFLIATDTSLPFLLSKNILPDCVISIDCQQISYNHFMQGMPKNIPLVLDLASPPDLTKLTDKLVFFTSGHPFSQYVNSHWRKFPFIDTSGGNVGHAAVSLAECLGAKTIYLFGTDFSFPEGKSYCRESYIYPYFRFRENRKNSIEHSFFSFLFRNMNVTKEYINGKIRYTTKPMISYKNRLEKASAQLNAEVVPIKGLGVDLDIKRLVPNKNDSIRTFFSAGNIDMNYSEFLKSYLNKLRSIPKPKINFTEYITKLTKEEIDILKTLLPAAAAVRKESSDSEEGREILNKVIVWTKNSIKKILSA